MNSPSSINSIPLQGLIWPEQGICTERDLYMNLSGAVGFDENDRSLQFAPGGKAGFGTYFNMFPIGKWVKHCALKNISLALQGLGRFELVTKIAVPERSSETLASRIITLDADAPFRIDLSHFWDVSDRGVLFFELTALENSSLNQAIWQTTQEPLRTPSLALSVTTFKREAAVQTTVERFESFVSGCALKGHLHLIVVDNGKSADLASSDHVSQIENENFGGAGGFSRGLLDARSRGASHCLFMDDDATVHFEAVERTWTFLSYVIDESSAVAGAMANGRQRWSIWENGALFWTSCKPLQMGTDLREQEEVFEMEFASARMQDPNFYGGWWYFAFPVNHVKHMPFPFFVRGDDVSFSLVHDFNIVTLPGVISFQESFTEKETPLTWYLDLRSHMAHHLSIPHMANGRKGTLKIPLLFFLRNVLRHHFNTQAANALAFQDVMRGPSFFAENADMATRRGDLKELTSAPQWGDETWKVIDGPLPRERQRINPSNPVWRVLMKVTLNGYLIPFFPLIGNRLVLEAQDRGAVRRWWGASEITYLDARKEKYYTVRHSKLRFAKATLILLRNSLRFAGSYNRLEADWQKGYDTLTTEDFWKDILKVDTSSKSGS